MHETVSPASLRDLLLFLAAAGVIVPLLSRLRISPILGFLAVGVLLGPFGLGRLAADVPLARHLTIADPEEIALLAELGVVFLLFMIGLELSWERLRRMRRYVVGLGGLQVLLTGLVIGGLAYALGLRLGTAAALGAALALSSTAIVLPVLEERETHETQSGRLSFSILLAQDLALVPILFGIAAVSGRYEENFAGQLWSTFAPAAVALFLLIAFGRVLLRPMLKSVARAKSRELFIAACLLVVIVTGLVAQAGGLSMALGAFVAGLLLAETEYAREVEVSIDPFKGLFLGAFFLSVGIELDLGVIERDPLLVFGAAAGLVALKALIVLGLARLFGAPPAVALQTGLVLGAGGEFAFVILSAARGADLIEPDLARLAIVTATLTMFAIPVLAWAGERIARAAEHRALQEAPRPWPGQSRPDVVIVGYGRVGRLIADMLRRHGKTFTAVDNDPVVVTRYRSEGAPIAFGDASRAEFLDRTGLATAQALVVTLDDPRKVETVVSAVRALRPDLTIVARARDANHAARLYELGATDAVPETVEASLQLAENTLVDIGVPMGFVIASIHERREEFRDLFRSKIEGDREPRAMRAAHVD